MDSGYLRTFQQKRRMTFKSFYLTLRPSDSVEEKALLESKVMDSIVVFRKILTERFSDRGVSFFFTVAVKKLIFFGKIVCFNR